MLYPGQLDTCTPELLKATKRTARELGIGIQLHTAMNIVEFQATMRQRGVTPIQYLHELGFLGEEVILGHCVFHNRHSWCHYPYTDDLAMLADSGASVAHAPYKYAKMGIAMESFDRYRQQGINLVLGTDTFPQDMVHEMRLAGLACRLVEGSFRAGKPYDVYNAATLGGARALGRDDLGRLAPGAKADMIVVDLRRKPISGPCVTPSSPWWRGAAAATSRPSSLTERPCWKSGSAYPVRRGGAVEPDSGTSSAGVGIRPGMARPGRDHRRHSAPELSCPETLKFPKRPSTSLRYAQD